MPIPERLRLKPIPRELLDQIAPLCDAIEEAPSDEEAAPLLAVWNTHANREYGRVEFRKYYGSVSKEEFIRGALLPDPPYVADLTYQELKEVLQAVQNAEIDDQAEEHYYLRLLETNLPDSNFSDLMYWPNSWFGDDSLFLDENHHFKPESELSDDQLLCYALLKSGRIFPAAPEVQLPFPMPD